MGFGFYGRAFTLADPSCSEPGCEFKGASNPGPCTDTAGYLAHYEIMDILKGKGSKKRATIESKLDKKNAVNYLTFDNDQWVSYDDKVTMKQKLDWAGEIGLGGALIWASDQGENVSFSFCACSCLLQRRLLPRCLSSVISVIQWKGNVAVDCFLVGLRLYSISQQMSKKLTTCAMRDWNKLNGICN